MEKKEDEKEESANDVDLTDKRESAGTFPYPVCWSVSNKSFSSVVTVKEFSQLDDIRSGILGVLVSFSVIF